MKGLWTLFVVGLLFLTGCENSQQVLKPVDTGQSVGFSGDNSEQYLVHSRRVGENKYKILYPAVICDQPVKVMNLVQAIPDHNIVNLGILEVDYRFIDEGVGEGEIVLTFSEFSQRNLNEFVMLVQTGIDTLVQQLCN